MLTRASAHAAAATILTLTLLFGKTSTAWGTTRAVPQPAHAVPGAAANWQIQTVTIAGCPRASSQGLALDKTGAPHIAFSSSDGLQYARWDKVSGVWRFSTVDTKGSDASLALDAAGNPRIAYIYSPHNEFDLRYAYWDANAGRWQIQTVDSGITHYPSLALDGQGAPHISYGDWNASDLKYTYWDSSASQWRTRLLDSAGVVGMWTSITLDASGHPHIGYYDQTNGNPKYAYWDVGNWHIETVSDEQWVMGISLAVDGSNRIHMSYVEAAQDVLRYARRDPGSGAWQVQTLDTAYDEAAWIALALDKAGNPRISYQRGDLRYTYWDAGANAWKTETVITGWQSVSALALDDRDDPHIVFANNYECSGLMYAHKESIPTLQLGTDHVALLRASGETSPTLLALPLNSSGSVITWTAAISPTVGWLSVTPVTGTTPSVIQLTFSPAGLGLGHYETQVVIQPADAQIASRSVPVTLIIVEHVFDLYLPLIRRAS